MSVKVAVTRFAIGGAGNQNITTADLDGLTPKAVLFISSYGITDGVAAAHNVTCVGAATGASNEWVTGNTDEDNVGTTDTDRIIRNDACLIWSTPGAQAVDGQANFVQWLTNGVQINVSNAPAASYLVTAIFFAGTDLSAQADVFQMDSTEDNTVDVNTVGFEPDVLILACTQQSAINAYSNSYQCSQGFVHNDRASGVTQRSTSVTSGNNQATSLIGARMTESYGVLTTNATGATLIAGEFGTFDADGFSCTTRLFDGLGLYVGFLALRFGSGPFVESYVGTYNTPTVTGIDAETGPNFFPQAVLLVGSHIDAVDTQEQDADAGCLGYSAFDADDEYCVGWNSQDGIVLGSTVTQSLSDNQAINIPDDDGTQGIEATFLAFDEDGWKLTYSAVKGNPKKFLALAIESENCLVTTVNTVTVPG